LDELGEHKTFSGGINWAQVFCLLDATTKIRELTAILVQPKQAQQANPLHKQKSYHIIFQRFFFSPFSRLDLDIKKTFCLLKIKPKKILARFHAHQGRYTIYPTITITKAMVYTIL
jgi:hypothetical protein